MMKMHLFFTTAEYRVDILSTVLIEILARVKSSVFSKKNEYQILARRNFSDFGKLIIKHIISKWDVLLAIFNLSELKNLANNAKIGSSLKFLLIRYAVMMTKEGHTKIVN